MRTMFAATGTAVAALMLMTAPASAEGKKDRARQAIAEAQGKVQTLGSLNAAGDTPRLVAQAQAALRSAEDNLKGGHKETAIADAHRASELADTAVNLSQRAQAQTNAAVQADAALQAQAAAQQTQAAQSQVDDANARAASAEQAARAAQENAAAAQAAAAAAATAPAPATVTTETTTTAPRTTAARRTTTKVVRRKPVARTVAHTTTKPATVTQRTTTTIRGN